ncbi:MAG: CehA/McbA family metallohydrolase [Roseburia sp.]
MREIINFTISRETDNLHEESFAIPHELKTLYLDIKVPEVCRYMGFVILRDETGAIRLQKLLGYGAQELAVGIDGAHTTIGGVPGKILAGEWKLSLGIFTEYVAQRLGDKTIELEVVVTDEDSEITEPIGNWVWVEEGSLQISPKQYDWNQVYQSEARWYKGDFHTHTRLSDGKETIRNAMKKAKDMEMDFYVPTEHNLMHTGWCDTDLCMLPGIEITTDKGHFNLFGITEMPEKLLEIVKSNGTSQMDQYVEETIKEANRKDWIVSLNHPFLTIWKWKYGKTSLKDFQCVEIVNDPTYQDASLSNDQAICFLDELWKDGHKIWGVGGSDSHNLIEERYEGADLPSIAGDPGTYVFCEGLSPKNLMEEVRKGHMCVTRFCKIIPKITVGEREYLPGDELAERRENIALVYEAQIKGLKERPNVFLVKNGEKLPLKVYETPSGDYYIKEEIELDNRKWNWVRLEVRQKQGAFLGYVNPVYCGAMASVCSTVEEIWEKMGED